MKQFALSALALLVCLSSIYAQITGKIVDEEGNPLSFATIVVENTTYGTVCDVDVAFELDYNYTPDVTALIVSYTGYSDAKVILTEEKLENGLEIQLASNPFNLGAVKVTARRQEETIKDVPQSITVLSKAEIERNQATSFQDILNFVPNVQVSESKSNPTFNIRGILSGTGGISGGTPEGVYVNGVFNAKAELVNNLVNDAQRIELLRGPQGTSFGATSISGALNIVTVKPSFENTGTLSAEYGSRDYLRLRGSGNLKLADNLYTRGTLVYLGKDRPMENLNSDQATNSEDIFGGRLDFRYLPNSNIILDLGFDFANESIIPDGLSILNWQNVPGTDIPFDLFAQAQGLAPETDISPTGQGFYRANEEQSFDRNLFGTTLNAVFQLNDRLNLTSISAFRTTQEERVFDLDNTSLDHLREFRDLSLQQFSQEVRLSGITDRLNWTTGVFLMNVQSEFNPDLRLGSFAETFIREFQVKPEIFPIVQDLVVQEVTATVTEQVTALIESDPNTNGLPDEQKAEIIAGLVAEQLASEPVQALIAEETQNNLNTTQIDLEGKSIKQRADLTENTLGIFAQGEYALLENLKLTLGLRYNREVKDLIFEQDGVGYDITVGGTVVAANQPIFFAIPDKDGDFLADEPIESNFTEDVLTSNASLKRGK